jgi:hypothetical protein
MRITSRTLIAMLATIVMAGSAYAAQSQPASKSAKASHPTASKPSPTLMASGKIVSFDSSSQMLVVSTKNGDQQFTLNSSARITDGKKKIGADTLGSLANHQVKVRYLQSGDQKTVESVDVGSADTSAKKS